MGPKIGFGAPPKKKDTPMDALNPLGALLGMFIFHLDTVYYMYMYIVY
jgi:hypothetical protein